LRATIPIEVQRERLSLAALRTFLTTFHFTAASPTGQIRGAPPRMEHRADARVELTHAHFVTGLRSNAAARSADSPWQQKWCMPKHAFFGENE
jgi:hypothetical protein